MTIEEIDAFLAVVEYGTLSLAAEKLFISQSTISQRLKRLEHELGTSLFVRQQGQRSAVLTASGAELVPIAQQWSSLWRDMYSLNASSAKTQVTIGSVDLINSVTFVPFYKKVLTHRPEIELVINTHHSTELHSLLESRMIDMGFVFRQMKYPDIISTPIYREELLLFSQRSSGYRDVVSVSQLDPKKEVYLKWNAEYELWHHGCWSNNQHLIQVDIGMNMGHYLDEPGSWAIGSPSLIHTLKKELDLVSCRLKEPPPPLVYYLLTHRYPKPSKAGAIEALASEIKQYLKGD